VPLAVLENSKLGKNFGNRFSFSRLVHNEWPLNTANDNRLMRTVAARFVVF